MHWMKVEDMAPVNDTLKEILNGKTIAAAWFVSNCGAPSGRDKIAKQLQIELQTHGLRLDIYGSCGTMKCPKSSMDECMLKLRSDYYFYLSFENSFSDDYVTEKLLNALDNYAVPVVFGGANYTRYLLNVYHTLMITQNSEGPKFVQKGVQSLPAQRKPHQKYIFTSMESAAYYPICNQKLLNFFNWTWTYKLNSDLNYAYFSVWNKNGSVIGPKEEMHWMKVEDMAPVNDTLKEILSGKTIAAAWFVSNCGAPSGRNKIAKQLQIELQTHGLRLDIYGSCGTMKCPKSSMDECMLKLRSDYYFYLSFENSFSDDYVTEKLLNALDNYAVPVVFGGANYTRNGRNANYTYAPDVGTRSGRRQTRLYRSDERTIHAGWNIFVSEHVNN
ncbi:unnamed protein product [Spodoptera exigua]|nr:unnamed protein product [Spodoptera exigua]